MRHATGLAIIALGAILAFAINGHPSFLNIQVAGWVLIATGVAGMLIPNRGYAALRRRIVRRRYGPSGQLTEVDERSYPPYIKLNRRSLSRDKSDTDELVATRAENDAERDETVDDYFEG